MSDSLKLMIRNNPVAHALDAVGEAWTMLILREAFRGARRFDDWLARLTISRSVLSRRLKALCEAGLFTVRPYQTRPLRHDYVLTDMGRDLYGVAVLFTLWEQDWSPRADPARAVRFVRRSDGGEVEPVMAGEDRFSAITPADVKPVPGPAPERAPRLQEMRRRRVRPVLRGSGAPVELVLELFGDHWTSLVLSAAFYRVRRYDGFLANLDISSSVLAGRLNLLVREGVLEKRRYQTRPARYEYVLTDRGKALFPVILAFFAWGTRWLCGPGRETVLLQSVKTGRTVTPALRDARTGERLDPRLIRPAPLLTYAQRQSAAAG